MKKLFFVDAKRDIMIKPHLLGFVVAVLQPLLKKMLKSRNKNVFYLLEMTDYIIDLLHRRFCHGV
jgi:hypothetical protein